MCPFLQTTCFRLFRLYLNWSRCLFVCLSVSLHLHYPERHMGNAAAAALLSETLSINRLYVFASLILQSHIPPTSAVKKQSTHPLLSFSSHITSSRGKSRRRSGGNKSPSWGSWCTLNKTLHGHSVVTLLVVWSTPPFVLLLTLAIHPCTCPSFAL